MSEFTCALLNAYPMGFYSPSTIVGDAQRHGVDVQPVDVDVSVWECTLEASSLSAALAVRMGLRWVKGLTTADAARIADARKLHPFTDVEDFVRRTHLATKAHTALAEAGALSRLSTTRRDALWQTAGWASRQRDSFSLGGDVGQRATFASLNMFDEILWDHRTSDHSPRGHPLGPLRPELLQQRIPDARTVTTLRDGQRLQYVGMVICRQRPATASGVTFMTLEDETGFVNLVVWAQVFAQYSVIARTASLLGVTGRLQVQEGIVHLIAEQLWLPALSKPIDIMASRDFH